MIFKLCTLLQVAGLLILLCHSSDQKCEVKFEIGEEIKVIDKFIGCDPHVKFKRGMIMIITDIDKLGNLSVDSKGFTMYGDQQIWINKTKFGNIRKVGQKFKVGQQIQEIEGFESSSKNSKKIEPDNIMTVEECRKNENISISKKSWKAQEWIEPIDYDNIEIYHQKFEIGDEVEVINGLIGYGPYTKFKRGIVTGTNTLNGKLAVYSKDLTTNALQQIWISKKNFNKIQKVGQKFKVGQQIRAIKAFKSSSEDRLWIKLHEIMTVEECHKNGNLVVSKEDWKTEEWIEPIDYDKIEMYRQPFKKDEQIEVTENFNLSGNEVPEKKICKKSTLNVNEELPKSRFESVYWKRKDKGWIGQMSYQGKQIWTKMVKTDEEAALLLNLKCAELGIDLKNPSLENVNLEKKEDDSGDKSNTMKRKEKVTIRNKEKAEKKPVKNTTYDSKEDEEFFLSENEGEKPSEKKMCKNNILNGNEELPKSKFNCVYWHAKKWIGKFYHEGKSICTAMHDDDEEVAKFVNLKCKELGKSVKNPSLETEFYINYGLVQNKEENENPKKVNSDCTLNENDPNTIFKKQKVMLENSNHVVTQRFLADLEDSENSSSKRKRKDKETFQQKKQYREDHQNRENKDKKDLRQTNTRFKKVIVDSDDDK